MGTTSSLTVNTTVTKEMLAEINDQILSSGMRVVSIHKHQIVLGMVVGFSNTIGKVLTVVPNGSKTIMVVSMDKTLPKGNFTLYKHCTRGYLICLE